MIGRLYRGPVKQIIERSGMDSRLRLVYYAPFSYVKIHDREAAKQHADAVYEFANDETIEIPQPRFQSGECPPEFEPVIGEWKLKKPFVSEITNARIIKHFGIAATHDYTLLLETASSQEVVPQVCFSGYQKEAYELILKQQTPINKPINQPDVEIGFSLIRAPYPDHSKGYGHWLQSYLTLLQGIQQYEEKTGDRPKVILEPDPPTWVMQSVNYLGFTAEDIVHWDPNKELTVGRLVVPSVRRIEQKQIDYHKTTPHPITKLLSPNACNWLHSRCKKLLESNKKDFANKFYISRSDTTRRNIVNREELLDRLKPEGFESYVLSELTFDEQVNLFANADKIVAPHGAGLANIMFSSDCKIFEIFGRLVKPTYYLQATALGLDYGGIQGNSPEHAEYIYEEDIVVEPDLVLDALLNR